MKTWKKNLMAVAVLITVCAGIYINWLYSEDQATVDLTDTLDNSKLLSSDMLVIGTDSISDIQSTASDYFAAVRLSRQEARDNAVSLLQEAMAYSDQGEDSESGTQLESIVQTALCEAQIESLVIAKGYEDCVAYISDDGISVAVSMPEEGLQQADVSLLADIVIAQTDYTLGDIRIFGVE